MELTRWQHAYQFDYTLTTQCFKSSINKATIRKYHGADIYSYHDMVLCNLKLKLKRNRKQN